jgi:hypothetical protein
MHNSLDPNLMTAKERLLEVAELLAQGFLRVHLQRIKERKCLAIPGASSDSCSEPKSRGEKHE